MRFHFCGDQDCPDWVLAEIATLSKITSVKMKLLCAQVIKNILGQQIDYEKINQLTAEAKFEPGDVKACIAALNFILCSAAKHNVNDDYLAREIQQLGLPKEHTVALCKLYGDNLKSLQTKLQSEILQLTHLDNVKWRVDYILSSSHLKDVNAPMAQLHFDIRTAENPQSQSFAFSLTANKLQVLLSEMKQLYSRMEDLD